MGKHRARQFGRWVWAIAPVILAPQRRADPVSLPIFKKDAIPIKPVPAILSNRSVFVKKRSGTITPRSDAKFRLNSRPRWDRFKKPDKFCKKTWQNAIPTDGWIVYIEVRTILEASRNSQTERSHHLRCDRFIQLLLFDTPHLLTLNSPLFCNQGKPKVGHSGTKLLSDLYWFFVPEN